MNSETPIADRIVDTYLSKCDTKYPDGSSAEDIETDLREPIRQLERRCLALEALVKEADNLIAEASELMTLEQLSNWKGVRAWIELADQELAQIRAEKGDG